MSRYGKGLKLNMSAQPVQGNTPRRTTNNDSDNVSPNSSSSSGSCVSSEATNSPEAASMVLAGCPRCLMYVMLTEEDPRCPKCKSTVLLDLHNKISNNGSKKKKKS